MRQGASRGGACSLSAISGQCPSVDRCCAINAGPKWQKANKLRPVYWPASRGRAPVVICDSQQNAHDPLAFRQKRNPETRDLGLKTCVSVGLAKHIPAVARLRCLACCCGSRDHVRLVDCCGYPQERARVRLKRKRWPTLIDSRRFRQHLKSPFGTILDNGRKLRESIKRRTANGYAMPTSPFLHVQHNTVGQSLQQSERG